MIARHYSPRNVAILAIELAWILLTLGLAIAIDLSGRQTLLRVNDIAPQFALVTLLYLGGFYYADLYNFPAIRMRRDLVTGAVRAFSTLAILFGLLFLLTEWLALHSLTILFHLVLTTGFVLVLRGGIDTVFRKYGLATKIAIVGTGPEAQGIAREIRKRREIGHEVACFVEVGRTPTRPAVGPAAPTRTPPLIPPSELPGFARQHRIKRILVATGDLDQSLPLHDLLHCKAAGYDVEDGHTFYEGLLGRILTADLRPEWLIFSSGFSRSLTARAVKRCVDVVAAGCLLVVSLPVCALVAVAIKLESPGPILFRQVRVGRDAIPFTLYKFRSMCADAEADSGPKWAEDNDPRVTRIGRWIRKLRIDEIPQAWNVLLGQMSFVGPRPERPEFSAMLQAEIPYFEYRHTLRPGITGWAQVHLPYTATVDDFRVKLEYDLYYLKNFSVPMDLFILLRTVKILLFGWGSR